MSALLQTETVLPGSGVEPRTLEPRTCKHCGEAIVPTTLDFEQPRRWATKDYCCDKHKEQAHDARRRRARARGPRPAVRRETSGELKHYEHPVPAGKRVLPMTRAECRGGCRPCPLASCEFHLYLEVLPGGRIRYNWPGVEIEDMRETCVLDVIERTWAGGERSSCDDETMLEEIGRVLNLDRERVRQVLGSALAKLKRRHALSGHLDYEIVEEE